MHGGILLVGVGAQIRSEGHEQGVVAVKTERKWIPAGDSLPGIVEAAGPKAGSGLIAERRRDRCIDIKLSIREIIA